MPANQSVQAQFIKKTFVVIGLVAVTMLILLFIKYAFKLLMLVLAGIMIAIFFRGIGGLLQKIIPLSKGWNIVIGAVLVLGLLVLSGFLLAPHITEQVQTLQEEAPKGIENLRNELSSTQVGHYLIEQLPKQEQLQQQQSEIAKRAMTFFSSTFGVLADLYIILFLGIFFTVNPMVYVRGIELLFPINRRKRVREVLETTGYTLRNWLMGKIFSMLIVGVLTGIGLFILGVPLAFTLALLAALLSFIPNFGPILALIPALLVGLIQSPMTALYILLLYVGVQAVESNLLTPMIQKKMISIPMGLVIIAQVIFGLLAGGWALVLAVPIMAILIIWVKLIYIRDILGDNSVEVKWDRSGDNIRG